MPTQGEARSRQTAYLATEAWWKTRVEALAEQFRSEAEYHAVDGGNSLEQGSLIASVLVSCAKDLETLLAERPSR